MINNELYYLATPYTKYEEGHDAAFRAAAVIAARLIRQGVNVYSPIVHSHPIALHGRMDPTDHDLWMRIDSAIMARCDGIVVGCLDGWTKSKGVRFEIDWFIKAGKSVRYYDPMTDTFGRDV